MRKEGIVFNNTFTVDLKISSLLLPREPRQSSFQQFSRCKCQYRLSVVADFVSRGIVTALESNAEAIVPIFQNPGTWGALVFLVVNLLALCGILSSINTDMCLVYTV